MHELIHSLGFHHMHTHTERDDYIKIHWDNIDLEKEHNYRRNSAKFVSNFGTLYDFYSIMHYRPTNSDGDETISPLPEYERYEEFMGQRSKLSLGDIQRINNMYGCEMNSSDEDEDDDDE